MTDTDTTPVTAPPNPVQAASSWLEQARAFVSRIEAISSSDPGARAALRSGLGKPLDEVPRMHRLVAPFVPLAAMADDDTQRAFYTVASLIAAQKTEALRASTAPSTSRRITEGTNGNALPTLEAGKVAAVQATPRRPDRGRSLGLTFADAVAIGPRNGLRENAAETRLNLLTRQSTAGLHRHLPSAVRQLCDKKTPPDWARLLVDLRTWPRDRKRVGRLWLQDFYRARKQEELDAARAAADADAEQLGAKGEGE